MENINHYKSFCKYLAEESGKIISVYFRSELSVESKNDESPVTIADKKAEEKMRELIMKEFPGHGIIGEEFGSLNSDNEYVWVLDPIDGTKSFICGTVTFGTLIALLKNGQPVLGVINQPILKELLLGDGNSAELNEIKVNVKNTKELSDSVLLTTDHLSIKKHYDINKFNLLTEKVKLYRNWGDCYGYYLVASGYADTMIDPVMSIWDKMALIPIIRGAGGVITDYQGRDALAGTSIIAAVPVIHQKVINLLNSP